MYEINFDIDGIQSHQKYIYNSIEACNKMDRLEQMRNKYKWQLSIPALFRRLYDHSTDQGGSFRKYEIKELETRYTKYIQTQNNGSHA